MFKVFLIIALILIISFIVLYFSFQAKDNHSVDKETNDTIKSLVGDVITIMFETHDVKALERFFTEDMLLKLDSYYPDFFSDQRHYYVSRDYMQSLHYHEPENRWYVYVGVSEGFLFSGDSYFVNIGFTQQDDGSYKISFVGKSP